MANLSEVLLRKKGRGTLCTGVAAVDEDLAAVHGFNAAGSASPGPVTPRRPVKLGDLETAPPPCGVPEHTITEVSGLPGSGKTALALALILDTVRRGLNVLYIGCDYRSFPWERMRRTAGWNSDRFDSRIHTLYIRSIEQLLTASAPSSTGLVVVEHYDTLIKRAWTPDLRKRAANACVWRFSLFSRDSCVIATAGCVKTALHEHVVPGPAVQLWNRPANMARILLYKDNELNYILSTGACFQIDAQGIVGAADARKPPLLLPTLSTKKHTWFSRSPKRPVPSGLPTPASKQSKHADEVNASCRAPPSSPFDRKGKHDTICSGLLPEPSSPLPALTQASVHSSQPLTQPSTQPLTQGSAQPATQPASQPSTQPSMPLFDPSTQPYRLSEMRKGTLHDDLADASHSGSAPTHVASAGADPMATEAEPDAESRDARAVRGESFLGLEIVPNSQVEVNDSEYVLRPSIP